MRTKYVGLPSKDHKTWVILDGEKQKAGFQITGLPTNADEMENKPITLQQTVLGGVSREDLGFMDRMQEKIETLMVDNKLFNEFQFREVKKNNRIWKRLHKLVKKIPGFERHEQVLMWPELRYKNALKAFNQQLDADKNLVGPNAIGDCRPWIKAMNDVHKQLKNNVRKYRGVIKMGPKFKNAPMHCKVFLQYDSKEAVYVVPYREFGQ